MLTQCPQCAAVFRLKAEHLRAARGFVACGECNHVFDVLQRIVDEPAQEPIVAAPIETPADIVVDAPLATPPQADVDAPATVALHGTDFEIAAATTVPDVFDEPPPAPGHPRCGHSA